ncbi:BF3164 family lipoprotein [Odoribacter lunatus]|uniref:BF3164 family lipoprotein n=1 Tax=Odoribacter lunatus TaxID=2941335 RepID=UPI00203B6916|nr:BF3164 family lipoprotein [Odoribacter lunatus]
MKNISYILLSFILGLGYACSSEEQEVSYFSENAQTEHLEVVAPFENWGISNPSEIAKSNGVFAVSTPNGQNNISLFSLHQDARIDRITRSRTNGQAFYTSALSSTATEVSALNFQTGQLFVTPETENGMSETYSIQLPEGVQHLIADKHDDFIISTGLYEKGRYMLYSLENGSARYFLSYPGHPDYPQLDEYSKSVLYASSVLKIRPDGKAFVCSDMRSGILDICGINGDQIERIKLLTFYFPKVHISGNTPKNLKVAYDKSTIHGFMDMAVSDHRIYVLYSGKSKKKDRYHIGFCQTLLVFDWNGLLMDTYTLDIPVSNICYDKNENTLYGIGHNPETVLVKFSV